MFDWVIVLRQLGTLPYLLLIRSLFNIILKLQTWSAKQLRLVLIQKKR
jgi:hypothetical protein